MAELMSFGPHTIQVLAEESEYGFAEGRFVPGVAGPPPHRHDWDEGFYVLSGQLAVQIDGEDRIVGPGEFVLARGGQLHTFEVSGEVEATFFATFSSAAGVAYIKEMSAAFAAGGRPGEDQLATIYDRFGVTR